MDSLRFENLNGGYDHHMVFKDLNIVLPLGSFIALTGPNGSGKSTLLKFIYKQIKPTGGAIYLKDRNLKQLKQKELAKEIGFVAQNGRLEYAFTVREAVEMGRYVFGGTDDSKAVEHAMQLCDIEHLEHTIVTELSGGEMQRVFLARALCQDGKILLLDEPVNHLDVRHQRQMMILLSSLVKKGYTVICVLHDLLLAQVYSEIALVLKAGKVVSFGPTGQVFSKDLLRAVYHIETHEIFDPSLGRSLWMPSWQ